MNTLVDTGPLVAYTSRRDQHHSWAVRRTADLSAPFYSCEAVLTEALHLLAYGATGRRRLLELVENGVIDLSFSSADHAERVNALMQRYESVPMSFADACLVRMAELHANSRILTVDADFRIYRKNRTERIEVLMP